MKKYVFTLTALISIFVIGFAAMAFQPDENTDRRDEIKERVGELKKELLISRLEFDEATSEKLIVINEKYFELMMEKVAEKKDTMNALEALYMDEEVDEKKIDALIDDLFDIDEDIMTIRNKENKEISSLLSTEEFGRYLIFNEQFHREIRKVIMEKAHDHPDGMPGGGPGGEFGEGPEGPPSFEPPFGEPPM